MSDSTENSASSGYRTCPYYATQQLKFLGLSQNIIIVAVIFFGLLSPFIGPFLAMVIMGVYAYTFEKLTANYPEGFIYFWISTKLDSKFFELIPPLRDLLANAWENFGLTPPPNIRNRFEP